MKTLHTIYTNFAKRLALILTLLLTLGVISVWAETSTFTWGTNPSAYTSGSSNFSEGQVTFTGTKGTGSTPTRAWSDGLRMYAGGTAQFSVPDGYVITKIEGYTTFNFNDATGQQTVLFTGLSKATCSTDVTVTYQSSGYTITYNTNGGTAVSSTTGTKLPNPLPTTTKTGYTFAGWYTNSALTAAATAGATINADITLYAKWTANKYTVKFNGNGNTGGSMTDQSFTYDVAQDLTANAFEKFGHTFAGWSKTSNGSVVYTDGQSVSNLTSTNNGTITLYAKWTEKAITNYRTSCSTKTLVSLHPNGGEINSSTEIQQIGTVDGTLTLPTPTRDGYTFAGWNTQQDGSGDSFNAGDNANWDATITTLYAIWNCTPPTSVTIDGTYHFFPDETITLTATPTGGSTPYTYQWQKYVGSTWQDIADATTASYSKQNATTSDVGQYRCVVIAGGTCQTTSNEYNVKCLQLYVYYDNKSDAFNTPLTKIDATTATASVTLSNANYKYYFKITDGCGNWYGFNGDMHSGWCTNVEMNANEYCGLQTTKYGTYVFTVNYSNLTLPVVTVTYPSSDQAASKVIYFDNNVLKWTHNAGNAEGKNQIYYRIGKSSHNSKIAMSLVSGTANLYKATTIQYDGFEAWHIANNGCWSDNNSIYYTNTNDGWAATKATGFETNAVVPAAITVTPTSSIGNGEDDKNSNCEFYNYNITDGMKTHTATVIPATGGTITVSYTDHDGTPYNDFTSGYRNLAHTCLLTITAVADAGYKLGTLTVNDVAFTSGNVYTLTEDAEIEVVWTEKAVATFAWSTNTCTVALEANNTFPTLNNPDGLTPITYTSSDETVATIDANGNITLLTTGTTTITASGAETENHKAASDTYTLTVVESNCRWVEVTDNETLEEGDLVVITMTSPLGTSYTLSNESETNTVPDAIKITATTSFANDYIWIIGKDGDNLTFESYNESGNYLTCNSANEGVRVNTGTNKSFVIDETYNYLKNIATSRYIGVHSDNINWCSYKLTDAGNFPTKIAGQTLKFYKKVCLDTEHYWVEGNLANVTCTPQLPQQLATDGSITLTFTAADGYALPDNVTVTNAPKTWDKANGILTISKPTDNVLVTIDAVKVHTVIWYDGTGNTHKTQTVTNNTTITVPATNPEPCDNEYPYFIGWTADPIVGSTTTQPTLVENITVTSDCDYYAVFAKGETGENGSYTLNYDTEKLNSNNNWGSYGTAYSHTATDGSTWVIKAYKNSGMQINTSKNASIKIPTCPSPITSIEITGTTEKAVGLSANDYTGSETITYLVTGQDNKSQTLDFTNQTITDGYIVAISGNIVITNIVVNFNAPTNYTSFITTCCTSWTAPILTYDTPLEENGTAMPQLGSGTTHGTVTYTSSNPSILSVNATTGQISAQAPGTATVTATWSGDETYCSESSTSNVITVKGSFSVIFHANGGTGTMANQKADESNVIAQLNANQFTRSGYAFVGWNTVSGGTGTAYADHATNITLTGNLTLYAQWAPVVTLNDASTETTTHPTTAGGAITLPDGAKACDPYEFVGWTTEPTSDWNDDINEPILVATTYTPSAPTTLYAVYKVQSEGNPNAFKLSYDLSGTTWYVGTYGSSPYIKAYSTITADDAVTFYKEKIENNTEKYWVYFERYNSNYDETTKEYLYVYDNDMINTTNDPSETEGWTITKLSDGTYEFQSIGYPTKYLSFSDSGNSTDHSSDSRKTYNLLPAVSSTYYAIPDCDVEIKITFETGNGEFVANAPATNPLVVTPGETITLPTCEYAGDGIEFIGWLKNTQQEEMTDIIADVYYEGEEEYIVNDTRDVIFYAYYKVTPEAVEFTGQDDAELKIYHYDEANDNYIYATSFELSKPDSHDDLDYTELCLTSTTWTFTNIGGMQYYIQNEEGLYLGTYSDNDNDFTLLTSPSVWNFTNVDGLWKIVCENSPSRAIMYNPYQFTNCHIQTGESNSQYSYVKIGVCHNPTYTTQPVLSQGFSITNTALVTSSVNQNIKSTTALTLETRNIELPCTFTITAPNITFYDKAGAEVTQLTASAASEQFELHFAYKPTAENTMEYPTITITDDEHKTYTIKNRIYARSLPSSFAIVAKVGEMWYALPSQGLNSTTPPAAYPIEVDNMADPTKVTTVPANADWALRQVYASSGSNDRFTDGGHNLVFVNNASPEKALNPSSTENYLLTDAQYDGYHTTTQPGLYEWIPTTTDLETYTLTNVQRTNKNVNINANTVFGVHASDIATTDVRFLPIENRYTPLAAQVVEWKEDSLIIMYNGDPELTASVYVNGGTAQTTTLSSVQKDTAVYELTATGLASNPGQLLKIVIGSEQMLLPIPYIISSATNDVDLLAGSTVAARQAVAKVSDLVVLNGGTLTADGATSNYYKFRNVTIYGGGKLFIPSDKGFGTSSLTMRIGAVNSGAYELTYPQLVLNGTINSGNINLDFLTNKDFYYPLSVPEAVTIADIKYPVDIYGANVEVNNTGSFQFKYYDGAQRVAQGSQYGTGWVVVDEESTTELSPNTGYAFWGIPMKVSVNGATAERQTYGIHRLPMKIAASTLMTNENADVNVTITAHGDANTLPNDRGWNYLGNPYLAQLGGLDGDDTDLQLGLLEKVIEDGKWTGGWEYNGEQVRYITTTQDCQNFEAIAVADATISPFATFFIQAAQEGQLAFAVSGRVQSLPARHLAAEQATSEEITTGIMLTGNNQTDRTGLLIADNFTEEYDFNADLSKFENSGINLYTIGKDGKLAFMAINQALAEQPIPLGYGAPADGEYTIAFDEDRYNATDISALYLIDYDRNEKTNLLHTNYSFVTTAGTNNERFALQVAFIPQNATSVEWVDDATIQVAVDGNNLLLNNLPTDAAVHVFDALGRLMYHTPTVPTEMQLTLPTGYYLVRIADKQHATIINTVIP